MEKYEHYFLYPDDFSDDRYKWKKIDWNIEFMLEMKDGSLHHTMFNFPSMKKNVDISETKGIISDANSVWNYSSWFSSSS